MRIKQEGSRAQRRRMPRWLRALIALMLAGVLCFGMLFAAVMYGAYDHVNGEPEVMLILGCQVKAWGPSILLQDRLDRALEYLEDNPDMVVVVSGGQGPDEPVSEARAMTDYLMEHGVEEGRILLEDQSHNTDQNFRRSRQILEHAGYDPEEMQILVVSNGFHLTRARMLAERAGFKDVSTLAAPSSHAPSRLKMYIREPLALVKSFVFDR